MMRTDDKEDPRRKVTRPSAATIARRKRPSRAGETSAIEDPASRDRDDGADTPTVVSLFLKLPFELRLEIYEYLLCSPDAILISTHRRQLHVQRPKHSMTCVGLPPSLTHKMPHVEVLRTCNQINKEATPILYGKNTFFVALPYHKDYQPARFFLWHLRQSTMSTISSITFVQGCRCPRWVNSCATIRLQAISSKWWSTTGAKLVHLCFPNNSLPHWRPPARNALAAHAYIHDRISRDKTAVLPGFYCGVCAYS